MNMTQHEEAGVEPRSLTRQMNSVTLRMMRGINSPMMDQGTETATPEDRRQVSNLLLEIRRLIVRQNLRTPSAMTHRLIVTL